jgi:hypothetical protein
MGCCSSSASTERASSADELVDFDHKHATMIAVSGIQNCNQKITNVSGHIRASIGKRFGQVISCRIRGDIAIVKFRETSSAQSALAEKVHIDNFNTEFAILKYTAKQAPEFFAIGEWAPKSVQKLSKDLQQIEFISEGDARLQKITFVPGVQPNTIYKAHPRNNPMDNKSRKAKLVPPHYVSLHEFEHVVFQDKHMELSRIAEGPWGFTFKSQGAG